MRLDADPRRYTDRHVRRQLLRESSMLITWGQTPTPRVRPVSLCCELPPARGGVPSAVWLCECNVGCAVVRGVQCGVCAARTCQSAVALSVVSCSEKRPRRSPSSCSTSVCCVEAGTSTPRTYSAGGAMLSPVDARGERECVGHR